MKSLLLIKFQKNALSVTEFVRSKMYFLCSEHSNLYKAASLAQMVVTSNSFCAVLNPRVQARSHTFLHEHLLTAEIAQA